MQEMVDVARPDGWKRELALVQQVTRSVVGPIVAHARAGGAHRRAAGARARAGKRPWSPTVIRA